MTFRFRAPDQHVQYLRHPGGTGDRTHKALTNAIESAQKKIESNNYGIRKNLLEYDRVMSEQREIIYEERLRVLNGESMRDVIYKMITDITEKLCRYLHQ